tara:strand:+ start:371 stop:721 length:351 start_codon:yes stop_codon:yes gene_type:complete
MDKDRRKIKNEVLNQLYEYKWVATEIKNSSNLETELGKKVSACTSEKIHILLINIFKALWGVNCDKKLIINNMSRYFRLVKLHLKQLKLLKQRNINEVKAFFKDAARIVYTEMARL